MNMITKPNDIQDESRYHDPEAINHITRKLDNVNLGQRECRGNKSIHMGNGESV